MNTDLLATPILYLSRHIMAHRADYYRLLLQVTMNAAWEEWILFMLQAIAATAKWTRHKIGEIRDLIEYMKNTMRRDAPTIYSHELAELIFIRPYCRIGDLTEAGIARRQAASAYLKRLVDIGLLREQKAGRDKLFVNPAFVRVLTDRIGIPAPDGLQT